MATQPIEELRLRRFGTPEDFYAEAERFLLEREAEHNLILGICATLMGQPGHYEQEPYLAVVRGDVGVVAAAVMTPPHGIVLSLVSEPSAIPLISRDVHELYPTLPGVLGPTRESICFAEAWQLVSGQEYRKLMAERIYWLEEVVPVKGVPGELRRAARADRDLLVAWFQAFSDEAVGDTPVGWAERSVDRRLDSPISDIYVWYDGRPVSMAGYGGPTSNGIRVGPVYTPLEFRGRGYASACVAALSQRLLDEGRRYCFLFTDLSNPTSNHIYQRIGYRPVCDVDQYQFLDTRGKDRGA